MNPKTQSEKFIELVLTCFSWQEAQKIVDELLEMRLVANVEFMEIKHKHLWEDKSAGVKEVKLIMQTLASHFNKIEEEVAKLHSNDKFVLQEISNSNISSQSEEWLSEEVKE